jgi:hypothetical protein
MRQCEVKQPTETSLRAYYVASVLAPAAVGSCCELAAPLVHAVHLPGAGIANAITKAARTVTLTETRAMTRCVDV